MRDWRKHCRPENIPRRREITERRFKKIDTHREKKKHTELYNSSCLPTRRTRGRRGSSSASRESLNHCLNARLCRLTETARLLKNVKSVFTRRSNAASRVSVEVELSRKLSPSIDTRTQPGRNSRRNLRCPGPVPPILTV